MRQITRLTAPLIVLGFMLAACGGPPATTAPPPAPTAAAPAATAAPGATEAPAATEPPAEPTAAPAMPEGEPVFGGTLVIGMPSDLTGFDPPVMWGPQEETAIQLVYNGLYRWKYGTSEIEPEIAAALPEVNADGTIYTIPLRDDVMFSDGTPLTAHDVKYTWDRMLDDATGGWAVAYYTAVAGANEDLSGEAEGVSGVTVLDDYTIQFELAEPIAYFEKLLAMQWTYVLQQAHVEAVGEDIARDPLGAGPYMVVSYDPAVSVEYERNPYYFRDDEAYADHITIQLSVDPSVAALQIERGELDTYLERIPPQEYQAMKANPSFEGGAVEATWLNTFYITMNSRQEGLSDIRVRQAIAHCIDREALIRAVPAGLAEPAYTLLPPGDTLNYNADQPRYELDRALSAELLAEAGYADGLSFPVASGNYYPWDQFAQAIQGQLAECNINLDLQLLETAAWYEFQGREDNGIAFNHWPYEIPDPAYVMDGGFSAAAFYPNSCCNFSWYTSPELEQMLADARVEQDPVQRGEMYQAIDELVIYDLALWVPLWHPMEWYATSAKLGGFVPPVVVHPRYLEPQYYWSKTGE